MSPRYGAFLLIGLAAGAAAQVNKSKALSEPSFIENKGQWNAQAQYLAEAGGFNLWITQDGAVFDFHKFAPAPSQRSDPMARLMPPKGTVYGHVVRMRFENAQPAGMSASSPLPGKLNYFIGMDKSKWATGVRRFSEAHAEQVYNGISARYYFDDGSPRYDLIVQPGADPGQIAMRFEGQDGLRVLPNGNLEIQTSLGPIEERGLSVYQARGVLNYPVPAQMAVDGGAVRFKFGPYDHNSPLVIDPLIFCTYLGGSDLSTPSNMTDFVFNMVLDQAGQPVVVGQARSADFPTTSGAYQRTVKAPFGTAFISKLKADGTALVFSTLIGGSYHDCANNVAFDNSGNYVITGATSSSDFPTTEGAFQRMNKAALNGLADAFVAKLSADGSKLLFSTFLGGSGKFPYVDQGCGSVVDKNGNVFVAGISDSNDFPVTSGAYQTANKSVGKSNAFISELSGDGTKLIASTYLGGNAPYPGDGAEGIAMDGDGNLVVEGQAAARDFPVTPGAFQTAFKSSYETAFVAKLSPDCSKLLACTLVGGSSQEDVWLPSPQIPLDSKGNILICGGTTSTDFPTTLGAFQRRRSGSYDMFVAKLAADLKSLVFGTFLGGSGYSRAYAITLDKLGNPILSGSSDNFPITQYACQTTDKSANATGVIAKLSADGSTLLYGSYFGGSGGETIRGVRVNGSGNIVFAGNTYSADLPITTMAFQTKQASSFVGCLSTAAPNEVVSDLALPTLNFGGPSGTATVTLKAPVGYDVTLDVTGAGGAIIPTQVMIAKGKAIQDFTVTPSPVQGRTTAVTITLRDGGVDVFDKNTTFYGSVLYIATYHPTIIGGAASIGWASLNGLAQPGGATVQLSSSDPAAQLPASVLVNPNLTYKNSYGVFAFQTKGVDADTPVTLSATLGAISVQTILTVRPAHVIGIKVLFSVVGGGIAYGRVFLIGQAGPSGFAIQLKSDNPVVQAPVQPTARPGQSEIPFPLTTSKVNVATTVTITAAAAGFRASSTITVLPAPPVPLRSRTAG